MTAIDIRLALEAWADNGNLDRDHIPEIAREIAALSTLPIAGEGKVNPEAHKRGLRAAVEIYLSPHPINLWNDAAIEDMEACMENAIATYHDVAALISSPGKDGGQEVEAVTMKRPEDLARTETGQIINGHYIYALEVAISTLNLKIGQLRPQPASTALVERLTKALEPFAKEAGCYDPDTGDGDDTVWATPVYFKIRDLREARNALSASQSTSREGER